MALGGNKLNLQRQRLYIPVTQFSGILPRFTVTDEAVSGSLNLGVSADADGFNVAGTTGMTATSYSFAPVKLASAVDAIGTAATFEEISTTGLVGLKMNTAGQKVSHIMPVPNDWDRYRPIYVKVVWTSGSGTTADTIDWIFTYLVHQANAAVALSSGEGALSTVIAQDTVVGANCLQETESGIIAANSISNTATNKHLKFSVEMDAFAAGLTEDKFLLGVAFEYSPQLGKGLSDRTAKAAQYGQTS